MVAQDFDTAVQASTMGVMSAARPSASAARRLQSGLGSGFGILLAGLALLALSACPDEPADDAGVGSDRSGCGEPGSHSMPIGDHSCVCEPGYDWCDEDSLIDFACCPVDDPDTGGETGEAPAQPCDADHLEQIVCVDDPQQPGPAGALVWACNGERWVEVPGYATFECQSQAYAFAYGCVPADPQPIFLCGHGPGTTCEDGPGGLCVDNEIIDTCVWGRRTIDRCSRLCGELEVNGPGFAGGNCKTIDAEQAACVCRE